TISQAHQPDHGAAYAGQVAVDFRGKTVYYVDWSFSEAPNSYGVGMLVDDTLCIGRSVASGYGVVVYKINGGHLRGEWIADKTAEFPGLEELEGSPNLEGHYKIVKAYG